MGCYGNDAISHSQNGSIFEEHKFLYLSGLMEPFGINKKCFKGFNVGLITLWGTSLSKGFALIL